MKKVYIFEVKRLLVPVSIYFGIMCILGFTVYLTSSGLYWRPFSQMLGFFCIGLVMGVTFLSFTYNKKRVSADMSYSLPVTKRQLFLGKYLADITIIFAGTILYLFLCIITFIFAMSTENNIISNPIYDFKIFLKCGLLYLATILPLFHFFLLFYYKWNSVLDGIAFIGCGIGILAIILGIICKWGEVDAPWDVFSLFIKGPGDFIVNDVQSAYIISYTLCVILGYGILIYLLWFSGKDCSIRTQEISNGIFGYKLFLPMIGFLLPIVAGSEYFDINFIFFILTVVGIFISYCIYHRSIKFNRLSYISIGVILSYTLIYYTAISFI